MGSGRRYLRKATSKASTRSSTTTTRRTPDSESQKAWRDSLLTAGRNVTPVIDRWYFKSIYYREPGGVLFEIATDGPGFTVDEPPDKLGTTLSLPPWFQVRRDQLDGILPPIVVPTTATTGAH